MNIKNEILFEHDLVRQKTIMTEFISDLWTGEWGDM